MNTAQLKKGNIKNVIIRVHATVHMQHVKRRLIRSGLQDVSIENSNINGKIPGTKLDRLRRIRGVDTVTALNNALDMNTS